VYGERSGSPSLMTNNRIANPGRPVTQAQEPMEHFRGWRWSRATSRLLTHLLCWLATGAS
jgi:hypothetical protein